MTSTISKRKINFFKEQYWYASEFLNNYISIQDYKRKNVLEVGSAEGGALKFFYEKQADCYGIELSKRRNEFANEYVNLPAIKYIEGDICDTNLVHQLPKMDLIIIRDVIEHIPDKLSALKNMQSLLKEDGILFLSFPPKYSPYAGHQQNVKSFLGKLPFIHLLPTTLYKKFIRTAKMTDTSFDDYLATKRDMISITNLEKMMGKANLDIDKKDFYSIRPCFEKRFGWNPKKNIFRGIPVLNEVLTLGALYQLKKK